jgi:hypothetical protein
MTYGKCGHVDLETMTDEQIKEHPYVVRAYTEANGEFTYISCKECYDMMMSAPKNFSVEGKVE